MSSALETIGKKYSLHVDQMGALEAEVVGALLGFTEPQDFAGMLEERVAVSPVVAAAIVQDVNKELFEKIRASLKQITGVPAPTATAPRPLVQTPRPTPAPAPAAPRPPSAAAMPPAPRPPSPPVPAPVTPPISKYAPVGAATIVPPKPSAAPAAVQPQTAAPASVVKPSSPTIPAAMPSVPVAISNPVKLPAPPANVLPASGGLSSSQVPLMGTTGSTAKVVDVVAPPVAGQNYPAPAKKYTADPYREAPE